MNRPHFPPQITAIGFLVFLLIPITSYSGGWGDALGGALDGALTEAKRQAEIEQQLEAQKKLLQYRYELERARIEEVERKRREEEQTREAQRREQERQAQLAAEKQRRDAEEERKQALVTGTGFFVAPNGYLITNYHVVEDKTHFAIRDRHGHFYRAEVIAQDANRDLALLRVQGTFPSLKIARSDTISKGQRVMAVGYPQISIQGNESKVTDGVISSFSGVNNDPNWFQISTPIQGGNSGGPLVTESGQVVGVVVATANAMKFFKQTGNIPQNVNYAIKANVLLDFLTERNISNVPTTSGRATIDAVDRATVLIVAKGGPIDVVFSISPEQRAAQERENARIKAEEAKQHRLEAEDAKTTRALAKAEDERRRKEQGIADQHAREEAARIERRDRDVGKAVPDWRVIEQSEVFVAWLQTQPSEARERLSSSKAPDVIAVLKQFQAERSELDVKQCDRYASFDDVPERAIRKAYFGFIDVEEALPPCSAAYKKNPKNTRLQAELARIYFQQGKFIDGVALAKSSIDQRISLVLLAYAHRHGVGGYSIDLPEAARLLQQGVDRGEPEAMVDLAGYYGFGLGVEKDERRGLELLQHAADTGDLGAMYGLAAVKFSGKLGVTKDVDEAIRLLQKPADSRLPPAQLGLGMILAARENRLNRYIVDARVQLERFSRQGSASARAILGEIYEKGIGVPKDQAKALDLYRMAASHNHPTGMARLGIAYLDGIGTDKIPSEGKQWLEKAAKMGSETAEKKLKESGGG